MKKTTPLLRIDRLLLAFAILITLLAPQLRAQSESTNTNDTSYIQPLWGGFGLPISGGTTSEEGTSGDSGFTASSSGLPLDDSSGTFTSQSTTPFTGTYNFSGANGSTNSMAYNGTDIANLTESAITKNGVTSSGSTGNFRASAWTTSATIDLTDYFEFSLTADAGYVIDMTSITFGIGRSATGPRTWQWRSSVDSFASTISTFSSLAAGVTNASGALTVPDLNSSWTGNVLDLSGAAFQNLNAITFRFYGYASETNSGTGGFQGNLEFAGAMENTNAPVGGTYWAGDVSGGGTGTWSSAGTNWATGANGTGRGETQASGSTLIFTNTAGTVTVSGTVTASNGMSFQTTGYTVESGTISLAGAAIANNAVTTLSGVSTTISSELSGTAGLTKAGDGTLTLSGANTFSGGVALNAGGLSVASNGALGDAANGITFSSGATLATTAGFSTARNFSGTGTLNIANGTSLTNSGTVNMTALTLANNGTLEISGASKTISGLTFSTASTLTNTGAAATLSGNVTANNTTGTAVLAGAYDLGASSRTYTVNNGSADVDMQISGAISSATAATYLVKAGTGRLEITGVNTGLTGSLQLGSAGTAAAGEVVIGNKDALGLGQIRLNSGTLLASTALTGANAITNALSIGGRGANLAIIGGANAIDFTGAVAFFATNNAASTLQVDNTTTLSGSIADSTGTSIDVSGSGTLILSGLTGNVFNDTFNVGSGLTVVAAKNDAFGTTTGGTVVASGGTVIISNTAYSTAEGMTISGTGVGGNGALRASGTSSYAGAVTAAANATIAADSASGLTISGALSGGGNTVSVGGAGNVLLSGAVSNGNISKTGAGTLTISNASSSFGTLTTGTGETAIATNATVTGLAGTDGLILSGGTLTVNNGSGVTFNGALSGAGILAKTGAGTLTLGGANSYSGGTLVSTGELVGSTTSLQGSITNNAGVTFNQSADGTYAGNLTGTGVLTKAGAGTLTLTGANSQGVGTIISAGALQIGSGGTAGSLSGDIDNAGTLIFNRSDNITYSGVVGGAGNLVKESAGTLTLSGANDYTGGTLVSGGAVSGNTTSLQGAITNNAAVIFNQSTGGTYAGSLSGTGTLAKTGSGTLTMSGVNSFSGATTISAGQLVVNGTNANSAVTVSDSTTLSGTGQVGALTVSGTLAPGNSVGTLSAGSTIFDADGTFQLEMYDWTGSAGSGWDLLAITGDLTLNNTALNPFVIDLVSLSDGTNSGFSINFNANQNWTNTFVTYSGSQLGETFASNLFTVSTLNFSNALNGTFSITNVSGGLALLYTTSFDPGATYTWDVGSGVWSDGANWTNNAAPGNDSALQFTGAGGTATNDQVTSVAAITFADTTGSITLEGNAFALGVGGIENDSTNAHTIANNMSLATNVSIISASNNLTISGNITNDVAAQTLTIAGGNGVTISGAISGQGDVSKIGLGTVTLSGANTFTGALSVAAGEAVVDGTLATTTVGVTSGSLALGADNALANGATLTVDGATATFTTVTFADTIGTLVLTNGGTVAGTGVLTATTYTLSGGTMAGALGAGTANVDGEVSLTGTMASTTLNVNSGGTLTLGSADRIGASTAVVLGGGTLALGANNDTVGSFSITSGSLTGTGTLTAATYSLGGGTLTANLGAGTATASSGTTALDGTLAGDLTVSGGTVNLGSSNRLGDSSTLTITSGTLGLGANTDTVSAFSISGGTLGGAGTLTASTYTLGGGTVSANLGGGTATATTGTTTVDGNLGGTLTASGGTVALNGTLADDLTVSGGTVNLGSANRLDDASTVNLSSGTLGMGANNDTVALFTISGGTLGGSGTLTAGSYALQGGTVSANLGTGTATASTGTTTINGNLGGALTASGGTANLNGTVAGNVTVSGGTVNLGSNDRIGNSSSVSVSSGTLAMGTASDTVGTVQVTGGEISGSGTLTGSSYDVQAGTISTALGGSGELAKTGAGTATLSGNSSTYSGAVTVNDGTLLVANNNALGTNGVSMSDGAVVANNGRTIANNFTIGTAGVTNVASNVFVAGWDFQTTNSGGTAIAAAPNTPTTILANFGDQAGDAVLLLNGTSGSSTWITATSGNQLTAFGGTAINATNTFVDPSVTMSTVTSGASALAIQASTANGKSMVFSLDMSSLAELSLSYAAQRTSTGFNSHLWEYSTNGSTWTSFWTNSALATSFEAEAAPVTLSALSNSATAYLRLTVSGGTGGNNRLDNILVNATTIGVTNASSGSGILGIEEAGTATFSGNVVNNNAATFTAASGGLATFSGTVSGAGSVTKTGDGTVTLSGSNSYSGGTTLNEGILRLDSATAAGTGSITQTNTNSTLEINTTGTVANQMSIFNVRTLQTVTLSGNKTLNNATYTVDAGTTTTESGVLSGSGGITKEGTGSLVVTASNSFTGATVVNAGTLNLNSSTGSALGASTSVTVAATLLISQSGQVNDNASVTLSGGTITRGSGVSEVFGSLNLTQASFLDFGTGATGNLTFGTYEDNATPSALLTLNNFIPGNSFTFESSSFTEGSINSYFSFGTGYVNSSITNTGSTFTITAIPEPSTYLAAAGLLGLMLWPSRKRIIRDTKKILGLRAPMRDRLARRAS